MARPGIDKDKAKARLLQEARLMLAQTQGRRLVISEIAERVGISQSYAHRFFRTKADLVAALAADWFAEVETISAKAAAAPEAPEVRLEVWLLAILRHKRGKFDDNPELFRAYLALASGHTEIVQAHVCNLRSDLHAIMSDLVGPEKAAAATTLFEDATVLFRTPHAIALHRDRATDARARVLCRALIGALTSGQGVAGLTAGA